jgi:3',5'-cyclic AMP phosphodiesterase CpdA
VIKAVVTHHPFDLPEGHDEGDLVGRAEMAMATLADCGADVFLAGHLHFSHTGHTAKRYQIAGHSALVIQAGTATSTRGRGEANSFNVVSVDGLNISVERYLWQPANESFASASEEKFKRTADGWIRN